MITLEEHKRGKCNLCHEHITPFDNNNDKKAYRKFGICQKCINFVLRGRGR